MSCVRVVWVIIKANNSIKKRIEPAAEAGNPDISSFQTIGRAMAATLATHLVLYEWSAENWRWYINSLEERLQVITHKTISNKVLAPTSPTTEPIGFSMLPRIGTPKSEATFFSTFSRSRAQTMEHSQSAMEKRQPKPSAMLSHADSGLTQPLPPGVGESGTANQSISPADENYGQPAFSIGDLQHIGHIEGKANETALVIRLNLNILEQLRTYYESMLTWEDSASQMFRACTADIKRFITSAANVENDLHVQQLRLETILRLIVDRKTLVFRT